MEQRRIRGQRRATGMEHDDTAAGLAAFVCCFREMEGGAGTAGMLHAGVPVEYILLRARTTRSVPLRRMTAPWADPERHKFRVMFSSTSCPARMLLRAPIGVMIAGYGGYRRGQVEWAWPVCSTL